MLQTSEASCSFQPLREHLLIARSLKDTMKMHKIDVNIALRLEANASKIDFNSLTLAVQWEDYSSRIGVPQQTALGDAHDKLC